MIEVSLSSRERDLVSKPTIYAPAVDEYWVVDLERRCVIAHRDPSADGYRSIVLVPSGATVQPRSINVGDLATASLFAAACPRPS